MRGKQWSLLAVVVLLSLWTGACGSEPTPTSMPRAATATPVPPTDSPVPAAPSDTAVPSSTPVPPTASPLPPTDTPTPRPTPTATEPPSPTATPVPPTDTATSEPTAAPTKPPTATRVPASPTAKPQPTAAPTQPPPPGENQGCYLFQNFLGADVTVTLTAQDWQWSGSFTLAPNGEQLYCLDPGRYTFTLDAPPPWGSTNGELDVQAGDRYLFPIRGRE